MRFIQVFTALCFASIMLAGQNTVKAQKNSESRNGGGPAIGGSPNPNAPDGPGRRDLNSFLGGLNANIPHKFEKRGGGGGNGGGNQGGGIGGGGNGRHGRGSGRGGPGRRDLNSFLGGLNANIPHKFEKRQGGDSIGEIISSEKNKENPRFGWK